MRTQGKLTKWNDERGFGFISSGDGNIFVHISAFPDQAIRPKVGERVLFDIERSHDGKQQAVRITRPDIPHSTARPNQKSIMRFIRRTISGTITVGIVAGAVLYGYPLLTNYYVTEKAVQNIYSDTPAPNVQRHFKCDGRVHCSQMTSLEEAEYFLQNCPDTKMDGDSDGHPCERQFGY